MKPAFRICRPNDQKTRDIRQQIAACELPAPKVVRVCSLLATTCGAFGPLRPGEAGVAND